MAVTVARLVVKIVFTDMGGGQYVDNSELNFCKRFDSNIAVGSCSGGAGDGGGGVLGSRT